MRIGKGHALGSQLVHVRRFGLGVALQACQSSHLDHQLR